MGCRPRVGARATAHYPHECSVAGRHQPEPVTLLDGTPVCFICRHCLVRVRPFGAIWLEVPESLEF